MLIDLNLIPNISMMYIATLTKAKFKIGIFSDENKEVYDFMLQDMENVNLSDFLKELMYYMEIV